MSTAVDSDAPTLTVRAAWDALQAARRKHRADDLEVRLIRMRPEDFAWLRVEDRRSQVVTRNSKGDGWLLFGVPVVEQWPVTDAGARHIVLMHRRVSPPKFWGREAMAATTTVRDLNRVVTEEF